MTHVGEMLEKEKAEYGEEQYKAGYEAGRLAVRGDSRTLTIAGG